MTSEKSGAKTLVIYMSTPITVSSNLDFLFFLFTPTSAQVIGQQFKFVSDFTKHYLAINTVKYFPFTVQ